MLKIYAEKMKVPAECEPAVYANFDKVGKFLDKDNLNLEAILGSFSDSEKLTEHLLRLIAFSDFCVEQLFGKSENLSLFLNEHSPLVKRSGDFYQQHLLSLNQQCQSTEQWMAMLRNFRQLEMVRFIWREANDLCSIQESAKEISEFARAAIDVSLEFLNEQHKKSFGVPLSAETGEEQKLCVLGMGKLGGGELNLSSDIDLIFFYQDAGETDAKRPIENQQYFVKLARQLIRVLDEQTQDGFVFRVDMRLRPYGDSGLLVLNQNAMELYYETQGRTWERYAFIKADCVAGDKQVGEDFLKTIRPFIYRKYVDFTVVESLREMKLLINRQVHSKGIEDDIKLGRGGIRELEFIVQALQLIKGGRKPELQVRSYYAAMEAVHDMDLMSEKDKKVLCGHYNFFRKLEHFLQGRSDQQTQMLPKDENQRQILAWLMGFDNFSAFYAELNARRAEVREVFDELFASPEDAANEHNNNEFNLDDFVTAWQRVSHENIAFSLKAELSEALNLSIKNFSNEKILKSLSESEKKRLDNCMAYLIFKIVEFENPVDLLDHAIKFIHVILKRSAYLVLLNENPQVFDYLLSLFQRSQWVLDNLLQHPFLLDELLQLQNNKSLPSPEDVKDQLYQLSLRMDAHDLEMQLEELRVFKSTYEMQAAALYLDQHIDTSMLGDFLSHLAEILLQHVCRMAIPETVRGEHALAQQELISEHFAVLAYGKLGSQEMGFGSDLDLVFIYNEEKVSSFPFDDVGRLLTRYAQKIIHLLSVRTYSGILYEVDMRLRPSGKAGPMVSSLAAFKKYQMESAWTWEHQALVKARPVYGKGEVVAKFLQIRSEVLSMERQAKSLLKDMREMQIRVRENSPGASVVDRFHLKSDQGGIVDIEFLAQFIVLLESRNYPELLKMHATQEIFDFVESQQALKPDWLPKLKQSFLFFRRHINELTLAYQQVLLPRESFQEMRDEVAAVWQDLFDKYSLEK